MGGVDTWARDPRKQNPNHSLHTSGLGDGDLKLAQKNALSSVPPLEPHTLLSAPSFVQTLKPLGRYSSQPRQIVLTSLSQ